jgi:hypothetical protein
MHSNSTYIDFIQNTYIKFSANLFAEKIAYLLLFNILLIDLIGGYVLSTGNETSIMVIYKSTLFATILFFLRRDTAFLLYIVSILFFSFLLFCFHFINGTGEYFSSKIILISRFNLNISVFLFLSNRIKNSPLYFLKLKRLLNFNFYIIFFSVLLGVFGYGRSTYEGAEVGSKGFFEGGNDIGIAFLAISYFMLSLSYYYKRPFYHKGFLITIILITAIATTTKAIIIGSLISIMFINMYYMHSNVIVKYIKALIIILILTFIIYQGALISGIYERLFFFLDLHDFWFIIFSGRNEFASIVFQQFTKSSLALKTFGFDQLFNIEMDFFDILFNFGYIGLIYFLILFLFVQFKIRICIFQGKIFASQIRYLFSFIVFIGLISGHMLFSTQGGLFLFVVTSLIHVKKIDI